MRNRIKRGLRILLSGVLALLLISGCSRKGGDSVTTTAGTVRPTAPVTSSAAEKTTKAADKTTEAPAQKTTFVAYDDAEEYYQSHSREVRTLKEEELTAVPTAGEAVRAAEARGLEQFPVTSSYSMNGSYLGEQKLDEASSERHPIYEQFYVNSRNEIWKVYVIGGRYMAYSVSAAMQADAAREIILSETDTLLSYDAHTDTYYETVPDPSAVKLIRVDHIDAATLEKYTLEVLKR